MSIELDPPELGFKRPFTHEVSQVLRLRNPNTDPIAFKVKTTAPKQYCVRPNSGRIDAGRDVEVQVLLQAMKEDPPPDTKCRDKFLVQSVAVDSSATDSNVSQIWSNIEQTAKSTIQEKKIRVIFQPADSGTAAGSAVTTNGVAGHEEEPPAYSSPSPSTSAVTPLKSTSDRDIKNDSPTDSTAQTSTLGAAAAVIPTNQDDVKQQLEAAKAKIAQLQADAQEGLRQRKPQEAAEKAVNSVQQSLQNAPAPGGVPIQYVAAFGLLMFLLAWIFF